MNVGPNIPSTCEKFMVQEKYASAYEDELKYYCRKCHNEKPHIN